MEFLRNFITDGPILPLFLAIAIGYAIGKVRIGPFSLGGLGGTLLAAIGIGLFGVETDENIKSFAFAMFIYSLGFVSGPQFFGSLGRKTLGQVHLAFFSAFVIFFTIWVLAQVFGLDKGTAAGLLAGATTESASIGTAGEALRNLDLPDAEVDQLENNIAVTYAVTYLFGLILVVTFASRIAPKLMGVKNLSESAQELERKLGSTTRLHPGQFEFLRDIVGRVYETHSDVGAGTTVGALRSRFGHAVTIQSIDRNQEAIGVGPDLELQAGDMVTLLGLPSAVVAAGRMLGPESTEKRLTKGLIGEVRDVVVTRVNRNGTTVGELRQSIDPEKQHGVYAIELMRMNREIPLYPQTEVQRGDVVRLVGMPEAVDRVADELGYQIEPSDAVDYIYLALGIIAGMLIGSVSISIAGSPVSLGIGGGCLVSGLVFGWLKSHYQTVGNLPPATALHLRDFGLAVFIASVGLAAGPQAWDVISERGVLLPLLSIFVVLVPMIASMLYARFVVGMDPVLVTGALGGLLTCTAALNASVAEADSELPVLGYTVPYAISNVLLTLLGPVIVLTV
ncbi:aspartate-alanine antiporter [Allorhodopirellula solitaria]|uniref:Aspartate/alanine antiporter n=1 Tax=Allorhodopirellula solitaria TaxID=2527987 RepID=A0A5C5YIP7_9BACT|nr:aspartate-alanine antiporter [Allorhodopirellula solitaria]TWT74729.1 Aspartate/alanine antiporter [Allorhodopirellula solitaria]